MKDQEHAEALREHLIEARSQLERASYDPLVRCAYQTLSAIEVLRDAHVNLQREHDALIVKYNETVVRLERAIGRVESRVDKLDGVHGA